jgi:alkylation response protein AidB-like acyl-CoA dehydrogenase
VTSKSTSSTLQSFREVVRDFLARSLPTNIRHKQSLGIAHSKEELIEWQRILHRRGWAALHWPTQYGGTGWSLEQKMIFEEECALADAPDLLAQGLTIVGPMIIHAGSEAQKRRFLPNILDGSEVWCQGFSEPGAGSDLAALSCRAVRDGDDYVVNGTKIWTSHAHWADWCLLLVRTATLGKKRGITVLLTSMRSPGVRVRALPSLDGAHVLNQLYFDDVRIPVANRIGAQDDGWTVVKAIIGNERILNANLGRSKAMLRRLDEILAAERSGAATLAEDAGIRRRVAQLHIELHALECTVLRWMGEPDIAVKPETSLLKLRGTELQQRISELMSEAVGHYALPFDPDCVNGSMPARPIGPAYAGSLTPFYFFHRKASISAGTSEVMRNMIAAELFK